MLFLATPASNPSKPFAQIFLATLAENLSGCTRSEILTYTALSAHADPAGHCWPGRARLSELTGLDVHHVSRATSSLAAKGLIRKRVVAGRRVHYTLPDRALRTQNAPVPICAPITDQQDLNPKEPCPPAPPLPPTATAALVEEKLRKTKTGAPDAIPEAWLEQARVSRPDLTPTQIAASADVFLNHHRAKNTLLCEWVYAWKNWIKRERAPKPRPTKPVPPPQPTSLSAEERAEQDAIVAERMRLADEAAEARRLKLLAAAGIDPRTGLLIGDVPAVEAEPEQPAVEAPVVEPVVIEPLEAAPTVIEPAAVPVAVEPNIKPADTGPKVPVAQERPPPMSERERQEQLELNLSLIHISEPTRPY